jgi:hypothetical protein
MKTGASRVADPPDPAFHLIADPDPTFHAVQIRILNRIKVMKICDQTLLGSICVSKALKLDFYADPDPNPAFHSNAHPDPVTASQNNADPDPQPWALHTFSTCVLYRTYFFSRVFSFCNAVLDTI